MIASILKFEEGLRLTPYLDDKGYLTTGFGTLMSYTKGLNPEDYKHFVITEEVAFMMLEVEVEKLRARIAKGVWSDAFDHQPVAVQHILLSMGYQMGYAGLMDFKKMWAHLDNHNYDMAAHEALDSKWAREDSTARAYRHAAVIRSRNMGPYKDLIPGVL